jgi:sugar/nucleoside kinase (ribokinase family)
MDAAIFGLIVADLIAEPMDLRRPPAPGGLVHLNSLQLTTGGNVCNTGIAMATLGLNVAAAGMVGEDVLGKALIERMAAAGLDTSAVFTNSAAQTSATIVAVEPGGERCFFHAPGVTPLIDADVFRRCFPIFKQCRWVQIGYFGLLPTLTPELPRILKELREYAPETRIAFDTVNPPASAELLWPILPFVDLFAPSRAEAMALTGETDPAAMTAAFHRHMPASARVAIKLDAEGCFVEQSIIPAYKVDVVDTTGAGDTWFAGLLTGIIKGMPMSRAAQLANRAAADCCTAFGASAGARSFDDTLARLVRPIGVV